MINRFTGTNNRQKRINALKQQAIVRDNEEVARLLEKKIELIEFEPNHTIITQGDHDDDLYMVFAGRVSVRANRREIDIMGPGDHFGEMVVIEPSATRSASIIAIEKTVVGKIGEKEFSKLALKFPFLWREIACRLGHRLRLRNELVRQKNPRPVVFIGSSSESRPIVEAIQTEFRRDDYVIRPWTKEGVFEASHFPIEDLEFEVETSDFAILVLGPDDKVVSRKKNYRAPRDNVVFELGLFMGSLSRNRTFLVLPEKTEIKIPSDLLGLTVLRYGLLRSKTLAARIRPVCAQLRMLFNQKGTR
jgi:CRP/FNR family transcriptional regulator, cyclic AMP receptor protein